MTRMIFPAWAALVLAVFTLVAAMSGPALAQVPGKHDQYMEADKNYRNMYQLYELAMMNVYNILDDPDYKRLEQKSLAALAAGVKAHAASGKSEAAAYAEAYAGQVLDLNLAVTGKLAGNNPLEGFYELQDGQRAGYLSICFDEEKKRYELDFAVWLKAGPGNFGRAFAWADTLKDSFVTSGVMDPVSVEYAAGPELQLEVAIAGGAATVKSAKAFLRGGYLVSGFGEDLKPSGLTLDGLYVLRRK
ncbi:hypothetical protein LJC36_01720 [Desulfovibrio sp. OttesenSCG-928-C14]|nr:hypothetical protein [Desulfovibrio sp. OttesenSCG-928-C14]